MSVSPVSLADRFRFFVPTFEAGGARLYAHLVSRAAEDLAAAGPLRALLEPFADEPERRFLPLRLLAVVHRWVLAGELPELAWFYPSAGGDLAPAGGAWPLFRTAVVERASRLETLLAPPVQHNEVARAAALAGGFLLVARSTNLPLRLLEVGASAGLLLRWDHFLSSSWMPAMFERPPDLHGSARVVERRGCDLHPIDPVSGEGALTLRSFVWADLVDHLRMLEEAIRVAARVPAHVDRADGAEWLAEHLAAPRPGVATVVYHSMMEASCSPASLEAMARVLARAGAVATAEAPLAHLRFEADGRAEPDRMVQVRLATWPPGEDRLLATADVNGRRVRWH